MGPDASATPRTTGCPSCGASLRPDALWCGQCHADLRPPPPPPTAPAPAAVYGVAAGDPLTQPLLDLLPVPPVPTEGSEGSEPTWPCVRCETANPLSASVCTGCGAGFLAAVRDAEAPLLVLPVVGDLGAMSRGGRIGLALVLVAAIVAPLALLTLLLTQRPEQVPDVGSVTSVTRSAP